MSRIRGTKKLSENVPGVIERMYTKVTETGFYSTRVHFLAIMYIRLGAHFFLSILTKEGVERKISEEYKRFPFFPKIVNIFMSEEKG